MSDSIRRGRTAYEILAYPHLRKREGEDKSARHEQIEAELRSSREYQGRDRVELTDAEQAIVQRLCETPRYALGKDGKRTLQPKIPFNPERRLYNYADIIGPAPKSPPHAQ